MKFIDKILKKYHTSRYKIIKNLLKGESKNLLDIGCGKPTRCMEAGSFLNYLGYGQGMDIIDQNIKFPFTKGDILNIPYPKNSFDVVTVMEVIEHIKNPKLALKEVHKILKRKGVLILTTPTNNFFWKTIWFLWQKFVGTIWKDTHLTNLNKKQWIKLIKETKLFKILKVKTFMGINLIIKLQKI